MESLLPERLRDPSKRAQFPARLVSVPIPVTDPASNTFTKSLQNGPHFYSLTMQSTNGVPFGAKARSILCYLCTYAVKTGRPRVEFETISDTLFRLGMPRTGNYIKAVKGQFRRWLGTTIVYLERHSQKGQNIAPVGEHVPLRFSFVKSYALDWIEDTPEPENYCELSVDCMKFFKQGKTIPVPKGYMSIGEPIRQDVLAFLSRKNFILNKFHLRDRFIPRQNIVQQFGPPGILETFAGPIYWKHFQDHVLYICDHFWPDLKYEFRAGGFRLMKSPLLISPDDENAGHLPAYYGDDEDLDET